MPYVQIFLQWKAGKWILQRPAKLSIYPNPLHEEEPWDKAKWSAHGNILLTELFAATNDEVIIILWQVNFIGCRLNCNSIYLIPSGLVRGTVYVYPFIYVNWNEIMKYAKYFFIDIYMRKYRCANIMTSSNGNIFRYWPFVRGIPRTKASDGDVWCFLWSVPE